MGTVPTRICRQQTTESDRADHRESKESRRPTLVGEEEPDSHHSFTPVQLLHLQNIKPQKQLRSHHRMDFSDCYSTAHLFLARERGLARLTLTLTVSLP